MPARLLYIASPGHSGSTILSMLLGSMNGVFTAGELLRLPWQLSRNGQTGDPVEDLSLCTCRKSFRDCPVWGHVLSDEAFADPYNEYPLAFLEQQAWARETQQGISHLPALIYRRMTTTRLASLAPAIRPLKAHEIAHRNWQLIDRVAERSGCPVVVDSSKSLIRFHLLNRYRASHLIVLTRDVRGVAASAIKNGRDTATVARNWVRYYSKALSFCEHNNIRPIVVSYEGMCADPEGVMRRTREQMALPDGTHSDFHLVAGNPARYKPFTIKHDASWKSVLDEQTQAMLAEYDDQISSIKERLTRFA